MVEIPFENETHFDVSKRFGECGGPVMLNKPIKEIRSSTVRRSNLFPTLFVTVTLVVMTSVSGLAQGVPSGYQEYFVVGHEQHVWDMMDKVVSAEGAGPLSDGSNSLITATANADFQVIYYDHWEDGYEADIFNPVQGSTMILGDGDPTNGDACDFTPDPTCSGDTISRGDYVNLASNAGLSAGCTVPSVDPATYTELCSTVPVNPRCATAGACTNAEFRFDGGDLIRSTGGPLSVVHSQDPMSQYIGGSTEILPREAVNDAFSYSIPVGEDLYGTDPLYEPFKYVDLELVAYEDGTSILVDSPGAGTVAFMLDRGQHWTSLGSIDDGAVDPALTIIVNGGTKVSTTGPISGFIFTGGSGTWATRHFALIPDVLHTTDYITTADGDDPAEPAGTGDEDRPAAVYIFNPDPIPSIDVTITDSSGSTVVTVPPNSVVPYEIPPFSTVRMTSDRTFWGITAYDYGTPSSDWGHSWLGTRYLTTNYTVSYAPGNFDSPPSANFSPVYIAPTLDGTRIFVDFDNDDLFDEVDLDGDNVLDAGTADPACDPATPNCLYTFDVLSSMLVFDPSDFDNTGTRVVANKPVALAWGQETDLTTGGGLAIDTGFTVYPPLFVDPVLEIEKTVDPPIVSTGGGTVTYTLVVSSGDFDGIVPLTGLQIYDLLPVGVVGTDYVTGSTLVTYPNLTQDTADPVATEDPPGSGRWRLDWTLNPDTLAANRTLTVTYQIAIPASSGGTPRTLLNEARASAILGGSRFEPFDTATLTQSDVTIDKSVDRATAAVGEVLTYTISVSNNGVSAETNAVITDPVPPGSTFCDSTTAPAGICVDPTGGGAFDSSQNSVVWNVANVPVGGPYVYSFQVIVNDGTPVGALIENTARYESDQTPYFPSNAVSTEVIGPELTASKSGPAGPVHPNEVVTYDIVVSNISAVRATNVLILDPFYPNTSYVPESMQWRRNTDPFTSVTDAAGDDEGEINTGTTPNRLELSIPVLPSGEDITFRFSVRVDAGTSGSFTSNRASVLSDQTLAIDTNLVQIPIVGDADVTGHLFVDLDGDGVQGAGEPDMANVDVIVTDSTGAIQTVTTDASGNYLVTVPAGSTTLDVDETDSDFPTGATLTTANDPQNVTASSGSTAAAAPVGYRPAAFSMTKDSDAPGHRVRPGQTVHYTISATNDSGAVQTNVTVDDPVPAGMVIVPGSTVVSYSSPVFRVKEYLITAADFSGTSYDLTLDQNLETNYFVIVQGSDGPGTGTAGNHGPDENYAALTADPFGTGELGVSSGSDVLTLSRGNSVDGWYGVVTVVECLRDCATDGFVLRDVRRVDHLGTSTSGAETTANPWVDIDQTMLLGGFNGAGCDTLEADRADTKVCHVRIFPSGSDQINWTRDAGGATLSDATSTVMVLEWGTGWTVQRQRVQGNNGADGAATTSAYNTATISSVARADTWVWGTGHTNQGSIGEAGEGVLLTLGDGVAQNAAETLLAAGIEYSGAAVDFEVYALTHPDLATDYTFKFDGDSSALIVDVSTATADAQRMAFSTNGCNGTGNAYPRPMFSARYFNDSTIRLERRRAGQEFPAWVQGIDFTGVSAVTTLPGGDPPTLLDAAAGVDLGPGDTLTITFDLQVDPSLASSISQITNTATLNTDTDGPFTASVTDDVVRPAVTVEPNNGNFVVYDAVNPRTRTYSHVITNSGDSTDSYTISALSSQGLANPGAGWKIELIDPATGIVIATDTDFTDGTWDGGQTVNTGSMGAGAMFSYDVRVTVPAGTAIGTAESTTLTATSNSFSGISAFATDETTVADQAGDVVLVSDQSGIVTAGGDVVYPHTVFNNSGATDTFDLSAYPTEPGWTATIYNDSDGDGVYTPGIDVEISNTLQLADGEHQLFFVKVTAPAGAAPGDTDVTHVTAVSRNDTSLFDGVSDTTTVDPASTHDLSGGGTLLVNAGDDCISPNGCPTFPGTLKSLGTTSETFDFSISASPFDGLDGLNHPTQLWIDTDGDGVVDLEIGEDSDGDGTWDTIAAGYDTNADGLPDVAVPGGDTVVYELRRPVDSLQAAYRDPVTLTVISQTTGEQDSVTATNLLDAPTHAMVTAFSPLWSPSGIVVEWRTGYELGTAGFRLERRQPGRSVRPIHQGILPALGNTAVGGDYRFLDTGAVSGKPATYVLWEIQRDGRSRILGIIDAVLDEEHLPASDRAVSGNGYSAELLQPVLARGPDSGEAPSTTSPLDDSISRLRLRFQGESLYFVPAASIAEGLGIDLSTVQNWIENGQLVLHTGDPGPMSTCVREPLLAGQIFVDGFENGNFCAWTFPDDGAIGETIAWYAAPDENGLYFFGQGTDSIYTDDTVYWLEYGMGAPMATIPSEPAAVVPGGTFSASIHFEEEGPYPLTSVIDDPDSDFWFWDYVNVNPDYGLTRDTISVEFEAPVPSGENVEASLTVYLQAESSDDEIEMDHQVELRLNGVLVGAGQWDGATAHTVHATFDQSLLNDGTNTLEIHAPAGSGISSELFYLDSFDLSYRRYLTAVGDRLKALAESRDSVTADGFTRPDILIFDISDPRRPMIVESSSISSGTGGYSVTFATGGGLEFLLQPADLAETVTVERDRPSSLSSPSNAAEYIVITGAGLEDEAEELAQYRRSTGLSTMVVRLQDVYDEFARGAVDPMAIRDFLATARDQWVVPPSFVVLVGDSSFDFKDRLGYGGVLLPSPMVSTPEGLFPSDHRLADLSGNDGVPEVAIGRIPARTADQLTAYIDKLRVFEQGGTWATTVAWVADAADEGGEFLADAENLVGVVPPDIRVDRIYVDVLGAAGARQMLLDTIEEGTGMVHFLGHSNMQQMGQGAGLLRSEDVAVLTNGDAPPILTAMTCSLGRFDRIVFDTLGEALLLKPGGGVSAVWAPTGLSFNRDGLLLSRVFTDDVLRGTVFGEAVRTSLRNYLRTADDPLSHLPFLYTLLGDPAMEFPQ